MSVIRSSSSLAIINLILTISVQIASISATIEVPDGCERVANRPVNVCFEKVKDDMNVSHSYDVSCNGTTFTETTYDDDECNGKVVHEITGPCDDEFTECVCFSGIQCDYVLFRQYTDTNISDGCSGSYREVGVVTNECVVEAHSNTLVQVKCENDTIYMAECPVEDHDFVMWNVEDSCEVTDVECIAAVETTTKAPLETTTTGMETTGMESTEECMDRAGMDSFVPFTIGMYMDCMEEVLTINITYRGHKGNWFGVLFTEGIDNVMFGEALVYTIGKVNESRSGGDIPLLYLYNLTAQAIDGVNYIGENGMDWEMISESDENGNKNVIYGQDLDKTKFDLSTDNVAIRWAFGENENDYNLQYHGHEGKAHDTLQLGLQDVVTPTPQTTISPDKEDEEKDNSGIIIGGVIGAFFLIMLLICLIFIIVDKNKDEQNTAYGAVTGVEDANVEMQGVKMELKINELEYK